METSVPTETQGIFEYLAAGVIKGVGKQTARRIVDKFGADTLAVIESEPEKLASLKGMTLKKARAIQAEFLQKAGMRRLMEFLGQFQLPSSIGLALWRRYADRAIDILRSGDPYLLLNEDVVAAASPTRTGSPLPAASAQMTCCGWRLAVQYTLTHNLDSGHCFLPREKLLSAAARLLHIDSAACWPRGWMPCGFREEVVATFVGATPAVYLSDLFENEAYIVHRILATVRSGRRWYPENLDTLIDRVEREQGISYAPEQREAVRMAAGHQIMLLTGGPGTGKTTSLRGILGLFETLGLRMSCWPPPPAAPPSGWVSCAGRRPPPSTACWKRAMTRNPTGWCSCTTRMNR